MAVLVAFVPGQALAGEIVPPGNSGVNQYTQTFPTASGNLAVKHQEIRQPTRVLGKKQARDLEKKGPEGKAAAELAAVGSPSTGDRSESSSAPGSGGGVGNGNGSDRQRSKGIVAGTDRGGSGTSSLGSDKQRNTPGSGSPEAQIVDQATGLSSSGELGPWMPVALIAGFAWCVAFAWRRRGAS
jgi:hypothetical protein